MNKSFVLAGFDEKMKKLENANLNKKLFKDMVLQNCQLQNDLMQKYRWKVCLVVFSGDVSKWWLRFLKKGFRHCFITLGNGDLWLTIDAMLHKTDVIIQPVCGDFDMASWYLEQGFTVMATSLKDVPLVSAPLGFFTCVEAVKRVLGIHNFRIVTPYKLYKFLLSEKNKKIILDIREQLWYI
ncbi:MAG: hypothetical protein AB7U85_02140 [Alphaproteobacteria bacterium]